MNSYIATLIHTMLDENCPIYLKTLQLKSFNLLLEKGSDDMKIDFRKKYPQFM